MEMLWEKIPDREGYEVSNLGQVRKTTVFPRLGSRTKILRTSINSSGYPAIAFYLGVEDGKPILIHKLLHRIVAEVFVDGFQEGLEVNHKDGNKLNARADNLEWVTHVDNLAGPRQVSLANWSSNQVFQMKECRRIGLSLSQICAAFPGVNTSYMSRIVRGLVKMPMNKNKDK